MHDNDWSGVNLHSCHEEIEIEIGIEIPRVGQWEIGMRVGRLGLKRWGCGDFRFCFRF